ncbi:MAG: amino acid permease [Candidatus Cloacimonetes bacterium]|nr:amino acid permease [Candidatus Cloacimonadota bacterium]
MGKNTQIQKFGTFLGVYTPSVLTILGLIMYLRFGWVLGNVGLGYTILIVLLASSITLITALSASAIATNMHVGVGGEYFMVSRSLGPELGGTIGIPLFLCRTLSITFYSFGLAEATAMFWPTGLGVMPNYMIQVIAATIIVIITLVSGKSAELALKLQVPILVAVGLSVLALLIGVLGADFKEPSFAVTFQTAPKGFWYVFAVFFPAVTGFSAGIGMSGDLKDPRKSIPKGTLLAVISGMVIYLMIPVLLSITTKVNLTQLVADGPTSGVEVWTSVAFLGVILIAPGIFGAILSSAFGSVLGAPRVLQSLALDGLAPKFLSKLSKSGQPTIATWVSGLIALIAVALGGLNAVAQFVTILFLTLYVMINLSAGIEKLTRDPSYRPKINIPWFISLLGSLGAILVMALLNPLACVMALVVETLLYIYLRKRSLQKEWGDVRGGLWSSVARFALFKLKNYGINPRNWRPHIIVFTNNINDNQELIHLANWFNHKRGILTICKLIIGKLQLSNIKVENELKKMDDELQSYNISAFNEINFSYDYESGAINVTQANGFASLQSNTIMFDWSDDKDKMISNLRIMKAVSTIGKSTVITKFHDFTVYKEKKRIDVWWRGKQQNGDMMLLLSYLLTTNFMWRRAKIILHTVVDDIQHKEEMYAQLEMLISEVRINAVQEVIIKAKNETINEIISRYSKNADLVFLGMNLIEYGEESEAIDKMNLITQKLRATVFVRNGRKSAGDLI